MMINLVLQRQLIYVFPILEEQLFLEKKSIFTKMLPVDPKYYDDDSESSERP